MRQVAPLALAISTIIGEDVDGSSDVLAIPNNAAGTKATKIWVNVTAATYILPTTSGGSVTATTGMVLNGGDGGVILSVPDTTMTHIAHLQVSAGGRISIAAVEA